MKRHRIYRTGTGSALYSHTDSVFSMIASGILPEANNKWAS